MAAIDLDTLLELVGSLTDSTEPGSASERFRNYLQDNVTSAAVVRSYIETALGNTGNQYNKALQDLVNHIGQLLGFDATFGRYRGVKGEIGYDGLWISPDSNQAIVVETKTTDVYTIKTSTVLGYINSLVSDGVIPKADDVLGLYVYGRFDAKTNQLENAIIVENQRERLRVISIRSLIGLLELAQDYQLAHATVLSLLLPSPIRIDPIVDLIGDVVAQEQERELEGPDEDDLIADDPQEPTETEQAQEKSINKVPKRTGYTGKAIHGIVFQGKQVEVGTWREALEGLMQLLLEVDAGGFKKYAPEMKGRKRPYVTSNAELLRIPAPVSGTDLFFETNLSANQITRIAAELVTKMGYSADSLVFETE